MFKTGLIDPRPAAYRKKVNGIALRDFKDWGRWGLHLSEEELASLKIKNPDTLGHDDQRIAASYWKKFIASPESKPYRIQENI